jgi:hypothetical protein
MHRRRAALGRSSYSSSEPRGHAVIHSREQLFTDSVETSRYGHPAVSMVLGRDLSWTKVDALDCLCTKTVLDAAPTTDPAA